MSEIGSTTILEVNSAISNGANFSCSESTMEDSRMVLTITAAPAPEMTMVQGCGFFEEHGLSKRKWEEDGNGTTETEIDDPLFVTKKRRRQRTVVRVKKVNAIVKEVKKKKEVEDPHENGNHEPKDPEGKARGYQLEILREALKKNTIVYLETGCGKTLIAVLRIRALAHRLRMPAQKRIAVFLVPTVNLVRQQSCVIDCHTDLKVGEYVGHMGVDTWKPEKWHEEIASHEVLVMTPQILLDLLTHGILKLDIVEILIFDECHHATKKHPYCKIMDKYRETSIDSRPQIFGMTASPVNRKGVSSSADADKQLAALEQKLDSKVYAVKDRSELESYVPTPRTLGREYEASTFPREDYKLKLQAIAEKYQVYNGVTEEHFKDYEELGKKLQKAINKLNNALLYCLDKLGILCALKAAEILLKEDTKDIPTDPNIDVVAVLKSGKDSFLKEALDFLQSAVPEDPPPDLPEQVKAGLLTPKVKLLVDVLMNYRDVQEMRCIVFVDRVVASLVLASLINQLKCLSFLRCEYLAGINSSLDHISRKFQQTAIENFRAGQLNLLVATNVAEEGLDVQGCHSVIRFDPCTSVRSYIQSRGRARRPGSDYIVFMEKDNEKEKEDFRNIVQSELKMTEKAVDRPDGAAACIAPPTINELESFRVQSTGAVLTTDSSINFMYRYCSKLPGDKYYSPKPEFSFSQEPDGMHVCTVRLPPNSIIPEVTGPPKRIQLLAKQVACLEACKKLHAQRAITDHLLPVIEDEKFDEAETMNLGTTKNRGAGTTKQKELHNTIRTSALKGSWGDSEKGVSLHAYKLTFCSESDDDNLYRGFTFLVETELDEDVAQLKVDLALRLGRMATASFYPTGKIDLTPQQLWDAKQYQELLFNGMFSKLLTRASKALGALTTHKSLVVASVGELWDSRRMYLLLPLNRDTEPGGQAVESADLHIDWKSVTDTAAAFQKFRSIYTNIDPGTSSHISKDEYLRDYCATTTCLEPEYLQMALGVRTKLVDVVDTVVLTIHTGMIYVITKVHKKNAKAPFPELKEDKKDSEGSNFANYSDYFALKHKHPLKYPDQPLLQAKQAHRARNLLARNSVSGKGKKKLKANAEDAEPCSVEIPPELCVVLGVSTSVVRSAYLVPSVMHRLEAALAASELRRVIREETPQCPNILILRIVEALTTSRCLEEFSLEGLELLGDSFLKYAQSSYLFLEFESKHEGQLSARRCREICNAKLHALAMSKGLPGYIRDEVFDPTCWVPPGTLCPKVLLCRCDLANLWQSQTETVGGDDKKDVGKPLSTKVVKIGKSCANGHRWLCSKTISDVVEALIGAYLMEGGAAGALSFMTWAGFKVEVDEEKLVKARTQSAVDLTTITVGADLQVLESILNYSFTNRALLVEAITHASHQELKGGFCYQRLEFLGDAVLDLLITKHLFFSHPGLTPGRLTDLRSAAVNNECFARVAVKHKFNKYLRHGSGFLLKQIEEFVETYKNSADTMKNSSYGWDGVKGPKVLGDLVESIAGAILVDSGFDLDTVWKSMKPLLSPIVTPETLPLHPVRELQELCHLRDLGMVLQVIQDKKIPTVRIFVDLGLQPKLSATSSQLQKRTAQKEAAQQMLALLEARGIWHPCKVPMLGESCIRPTAPAEKEIQKSSSGGFKRKLDELQQGDSFLASPDDCPGGASVNKKERPSCTTLHEPIFLIADTAECTEVAHDNPMISCGTAILMTSEHKKRELDSESHVVEVPA
ncbi:unnamed protein product [Calypogeia fissa]